MKQYVIDGFRLEEYQKLKAYLGQYLKSSAISGVYWLKMEQEILTPLQKMHTDCHPHVVALMLEETHLSCEFLVRVEKKIKCD